MGTRKIRSFLLAFSVLLSILLACLGPAGDIQAKSSAGTTATFATVITVNSTLDPDPYQRLCHLLDRPLYAAQGGQPGTWCSETCPDRLRHPHSDAGYNAALNIWKIQFIGNLRQCQRDPALSQWANHH